MAYSLLSLLEGANIDWTQLLTTLGVIIGILAGAYAIRKTNAETTNQYAQANKQSSETITILQTQNDNLRKRLDERDELIRVLSAQLEANRRALCLDPVNGEARFEIEPRRKTKKPS